MNTLQAVDKDQNKSIRVRDIPPLSVRLPAELREDLLRESQTSGRSLHAEMLAALKFWVDVKAGRVTTPGMHEGERVKESAPTGYNVMDPTDSRIISSSERAVLAVFRKLPPDKQLALLTLLRNN